MQIIQQLQQSVKNSEHLRMWECEKEVNNILKYIAIENLYWTDDKIYLVLINLGQGES